MDKNLRMLKEKVLSDGSSDTLLKYIKHLEKALKRKTNRIKHLNAYIKQIKPDKGSEIEIDLNRLSKDVLYIIDWFSSNHPDFLHSTKTTIIEMLIEEGVDAVYKEIKAAWKVLNNKVQ